MEFGEIRYRALFGFDFSVAFDAEPPAGRETQKQQATNEKHPLLHRISTFY
jgi:hypothetical protein